MTTAPCWTLADWLPLLDRPDLGVAADDLDPLRQLAELVRIAGEHPHGVPGLQQLPRDMAADMAARASDQIHVHRLVRIGGARTIGLALQWNNPSFRNFLLHRRNNHDGPQ